MQEDKRASQTTPYVLADKKAVTQFWVPRACESSHIGLLHLGIFGIYFEQLNDSSFF